MTFYSRYKELDKLAVNKNAKFGGAWPQYDYRFTAQYSTLAY